METKKKIEVTEVVDMQECIIEPQLSRLKIGDMPKGFSIELQITSISCAKTNYGNRYDFIGRDVDNNPFAFSSWNIRNCAALPVKIGSVLKLTNNDNVKFEAVMLK